MGLIKYLRCVLPANVANDPTLLGTCGSMRFALGVSPPTAETDGKGGLHEVHQDISGITKIESVIVTRQLVNLPRELVRRLHH